MNFGERIMGKLFVIVFVGIFVLQGCFFQSVQSEMEEAVLYTLQTDSWGEGHESVIFDRESKTYKIISHSFAAMAQREQSGTHIWLNYESWNHFLEARIEELYGETDERATVSSLGGGYSVNKLSPDGETLLIVEDGMLVFDVVNGYADSSE